MPVQRYLAAVLAGSTVYTVSVAWSAVRGLARRDRAGSWDGLERRHEPRELPAAAGAEGMVVPPLHFRTGRRPYAVRKRPLLDGHRAQTPHCRADAADCRGGRHHTD